LARKILLADDSVTAQNMGRKILTDAGYEVMTVNNGSAALKRVTEQRPDLIVLDVYMPGYSGLEVCQRLKDSGDTSRIPILLTVGKLEPFKPEDARRVGADAFIVKPFEASELLSALTRLEDRLVPSADNTRFSNQVSGIERFISEQPKGRKAPPAAEETESGWKSRLRFPTKKPKVEEPEPEPEPDFVTPQSFKDFRDTSNAAEKAKVEAHAANVPTQVPGLVPDIPRDITPEELDALSALVAKLDGPIPKQEDIAPLSETLGPATRAAEPKEASTEPAEKPAEEPVEAKAEKAAEPESQPQVTAQEPEFAPAPVDRDDEPVFATAAMAPPEEVRAEEPEAVSAATISETPKVEEKAAEKVEATAEEVAAAESKAEEVSAAAIPAEVAEAESAVPVEATTPEAVDEKAPSEEELAEALRLLTPSHAGSNGEGATMASPEIAKSNGDGTRWMAEAVTLSAEEAALSLEAEMFQSLAKPVDASATVSAETPRNVAEEIVAAANESAVSNVVAPEVPAGAQQAAAALSMEAAEGASASSSAAQEQPTTFAEALLQHASGEVAAAIDRVAETAANVVASAEDQTTNQEIAGGEDSMGKDGKKSGKTGWHQIRASAPAAKTDVVEAAKQSDVDLETAKAMAAAASTDGSPATPASAADPSAIASIVDSVLADLRPKIVEEIAKKLAGK
jgi:twitching motility two-component system response regulator PilH